ncbi:unnamed protein product, partial [Mesorhabditis belari]|uniref:Uncharacterized protein n=1 Tax=Mesorhabditis belari TaxID=2138241 RepID=A0AAF3FP70_9BILA
MLSADVTFLLQALYTFAAVIAQTIFTGYLMFSERHFKNVHRPSCIAIFISCSCLLIFNLLTMKLQVYTYEWEFFRHIQQFFLDNKNIGNLCSYIAAYFAFVAYAVVFTTSSLRLGLNLSFVRHNSQALTLYFLDYLLPLPFVIYLEMITPDTTNITLIIKAYRTVTLILSTYFTMLTAATFVVNSLNYYILYTQRSSARVKRFMLIRMLVFFLLEGQLASHFVSFILQKSH